MEGLEAIIERILAHARDKAGEITRQSDKAVKAVVSQSGQECEQIRLQAEKQGEAQAGAVISRARSLAALDSRKALLGVRKALIDRAIDQAGTILSHMPDPERLAFYRHLLNQSGFQSGEIILNTHDRHLASGLLSGTAISLSDEAGQFNGGLIVRDGQIEENLTFEAIIAYRYPELVSLAASVLFDQDDPAGAPSSGPAREKPL